MSIKYVMFIDEKGHGTMIDYTENGLKLITDQSIHVRECIEEFENGTYPSMHKVIPTVDVLSIF